MGKKSKKIKKNGLIPGAAAWDKAFHKRMQKRRLRTPSTKGETPIANT